VAVRRRAAGWGAGLRRWMLPDGLPPSPLLQLGLAGVGLRGLGWGLPSASVAGPGIQGGGLWRERRRSGGGRRPLGAVGCPLGCEGNEVAAGVEHAGVSGPPAGSEDGGSAAHHIPSVLECLSLLRWLVGGAGVGSDRGNPWLPAAATMSTALWVSYSFLKATSRFAPLSLPNLPVSGENLNTLGGGGALASFPS
jgi:hypothetical protein